MEGKIGRREGQRGQPEIVASAPSMQLGGSGLTYIYSWQSLDSSIIGVDL